MNATDLSKTDVINIFCHKNGHLPERKMSLRYDNKNFIFKVFLHGMRVGYITEKEVLSNIENGLYVIIQ